jgi:hypothetical protein
VLGGRADDGPTERYEDHVAACADCRRFDRRLRAIYRGPMLPTDLGPRAHEREFSAILRRLERARARSPGERRAAAVPLALAACLVVAVLLSAKWLTLRWTGAAACPAPVAGAADLRADATDRSDEGGIDHPAQMVGRVLGGSASIVDVAAEAPDRNMFTPGTRIVVERGESLQVGLLGKILANFHEGADVEWTTASPDLIELSLERGLVAIRYDRLASDPVLQIRTPTAIVRVIGTVFTVHVQDGKHAVVSTLRGQVEVLDRSTGRLVAEVAAGYRFDVTTATFADVGKIEVRAALPLSTEKERADGQGEAQIPATWVVPGLPEDPEHRTIEHVLAWGGREDLAGEPVRGAPTPRRQAHRPAVVQDNEGADLMAMLMRDAEATREEELTRHLARCRDLYDSLETRHAAAICVRKFMTAYGQDARAVEGYLLNGMLRMDYALDYRAAEVAFREFLARAPTHEKAELAHYRLWLVSTEAGRIAAAVAQGRAYLTRYPDGRYVGQVLQRFPELKSSYGTGMP